MKVHPAPRKRNITFQYNRNLTPAEALVGRQKKLRKLPHVFSKVLELPFDSDADVEIQEDATGFQFVVAADDVWDDVRAHAIQIHPGVTKVVIREGDGGPELLVDDLKLDRWRFRLPSCTRPDLATAVYVGGELVVTIPKGETGEDLDDEETGVWGDANGGLGGGGIGRLVYVQ